MRLICRWHRKSRKRRRSAMTDITELKRAGADLRRWRYRPEQRLLERTKN